MAAPDRQEESSTSDLLSYDLDAAASSSFSFGKPAPGGAHRPSASSSNFSNPVPQPATTNFGGDVGGRQAFGSGGRSFFVPGEGDGDDIARALTPFQPAQSTAFQPPAPTASSFNPTPSASASAAPSSSSHSNPQQPATANEPSPLRPALKKRRTLLDPPNPPANTSRRPAVTHTSNSTTSPVYSPPSGVVLPDGRSGSATRMEGAGHMLETDRDVGGRGRSKGGVEGGSAGIWKGQRGGPLPTAQRNSGRKEEEMIQEEERDVQEQMEQFGAEEETRHRPHTSHRSRPSADIAPSTDDTNLPATKSDLPLPIFPSGPSASSRNFPTPASSAPIERRKPSYGSASGSSQNFQRQQRPSSQQQHQQQQRRQQRSHLQPLSPSRDSTPPQQSIPTPQSNPNARSTSQSDASAQHHRQPTHPFPNAGPPSSSARRHPSSSSRREAQGTPPIADSLLLGPELGRDEQQQPPKRVRSSRQPEETRSQHFSRPSEGVEEAADERRGEKETRMDVDEAEVEVPAFQQQQLARGSSARPAAETEAEVDAARERAGRDEEEDEAMGGRAFEEVEEEEDVADEDLKREMDLLKRVAGLKKALKRELEEKEKVLNDLRLQDISAATSLKKKDDELKAIKRLAKEAKSRSEKIEISFSSFRKEHKTSQQEFDSMTQRIYDSLRELGIQSSEAIEGALDNLRSDESWLALQRQHIIDIIRPTEAESDECKTLYEASQAVIAVLREDLQNRSGTLAEKADRVDQLEKMLKGEREEYKRRERTERTKVTEDIVKACAVAEADLERAHDATIEAQTRLEAAERERSKFELEVEKLGLKLQSTSERTSDVAESLKREEERSRSLVEEVEEARRKTAKVEEQLQVAHETERSFRDKLQSINDFEFQIRELTSSVRSADERYSLINDQLTNASAALQFTNDKLLASETAQACTSNELVNTQRRLAERSSDSDALEKRLNEEVQRLKGQVEMGEAEIGGVRAEVERLRKEVEVTRRERSAEREGWKGEKKGLEKEKAELERRVKKEEEAAKTQAKLYETTRATKEALESKLSDLVVDQSDVDSRLKDYSERYKKLLDEKQQVQTSLDHALQAERDATSGKKEAERELEKVQKKTSETQNKISSLESELSKATRKIPELQASYDRVTASSQTSTVELATATTTIASLTQQLADLQSKSENFARTQTDSTEAVQRLKEKLSSWEKRAKELMEKRKTMAERSLTGGLDSEEKKLVESVWKQVETLKEKELMDRDNTIKRLEVKAKASEDKYLAEHKLKQEIEAKLAKASTNRSRTLVDPQQYGRSSPLSEVSEHGSSANQNTHSSDSPSRGAKGKSSGSVSTVSCASGSASGSTRKSKPSSDMGPPALPGPGRLSSLNGVDEEEEDRYDDANIETFINQGMHEEDEDDRNQNAAADASPPRTPADPRHGQYLQVFPPSGVVPPGTARPSATPASSSRGGGSSSLSAAPSLSHRVGSGSNGGNSAGGGKKRTATEAPGTGKGESQAGGSTVKKLRSQAAHAEPASSAMSSVGRRGSGPSSTQGSSSRRKGGK